MNEEIGFDLPKQLSSIIKVIGVGGAGCNAVEYMSTQNISSVDLIVCNTDNQALEGKTVANKLQIGDSGLGAGGNPEVAKKAARESEARIENMIVPNTKMLFILAGMGGGTGTGAAPVVAEIAKRHNILTVAVVSYPFKNEGRTKQQKAEAGLAELKANVDAVIVVNNNKLVELFGNLAFTKTLAAANEVMAGTVKRISELIILPCVMNLDYKDVESVLQNSKTALMGYGKSSEDNRAEIAAKQALFSPLLNDNSLKGAQKVLLLIISGTNELTTFEIDEIINTVIEEAGEGVDLKWGYNVDSSTENEVAVSIIATGMSTGYNNNSPISFNVEPERLSTPIISKLKESTIHLYGDDKHKQLDLFVNTNKIEVEDNIPTATVKDLNKDVLPPDRSQVISELQAKSVPLSTELIEQMEKEPAYTRKNIVIDDSMRSSNENELYYVDKNHNIVESSLNKYLNPKLD